MLKKIDEIFIKIQRTFGGMIMFVMLTCCTLQVLLRLINVPAAWTEEFSRVAIAYLTFLMSALGVRLNSHPSVDFLVRKLPDRARWSLKILTELLIVLVGVILTYYGWLYFQRTMTDHSTTYHYAKAWWYWPIPFSGVVTIIYSLRNIIQLVMSIIKNKDLTGFQLTEADMVQEMDMYEGEEDDDL